MKKLFEALSSEYTLRFESFPWDRREELAVWSAQTYYYTSHITRIMASCAANIKVGDDVIHKFFIRHLSEEMGHQHLAAQDVKALGFDISQIPELPSTRLFYEPQYYKSIKDPLSFYGFGLMLELLAITGGGKIYQRIRSSGLDSSFLRVHIKEDESHAPAVENVLKSVSPATQRRIEDNCAQSFLAYDMMLIEIKAFAEKLREKELKDTKKVA